MRGSSLKLAIPTIGKILSGDQSCEHGVNKKTTQYILIKNKIIQSIIINFTMGQVWTKASPCLRHEFVKFGRVKLCCVWMKLYRSCLYFKSILRILTFSNLFVPCIKKTVHNQNFQETCFKYTKQTGNWQYWRYWSFCFYILIKKNIAVTMVTLNSWLTLKLPEL